jgi:glycosyltransferase involved in cell wall biosynthesis
VKRLFFCILFVFSFLGAKEKTICLNMIVKNEAHVIKRCLASAKPLIDHWVIVDTGSTDGTQEIIKEFMKEIPGELYERPWVNFGHNRTEALELARGKGDYLLFIDADEEFSTEAHFKFPKLTEDSYLMVIDHGGSRYFRRQLINNRLNWCWKGVLHEYLDSPFAKTEGKIEGIHTIYRSEGARSLDPKKYEKDALVFEKALLEEPDNERYMFYLAQSYKDCGNIQKAIEWYEKRAAKGGWDQEVFWSLYQIARMKDRPGVPDGEIVEAYLRAYHYRPSRVEPLARLSTFYRVRNQYLLSYLVAMEAIKTPPSEDILFVETDLCTFWPSFEASISAYWLGHYKESYELCNKLFEDKALPSCLKEYVEGNLKFAKEKMSS